MSRIISLRQAIPYLRDYAGKTFVIKVGGGAIETDTDRRRLAGDVAALHRMGVRVVLVHGGGPQLDVAAHEAGLTTTRIAGRRVTSPELIQQAARVWRGELSLALVGALRAEGEVAVGLSGADGAMLTASERPPRVVVDDSGERRTVDYGAVGDLTGFDGTLLTAVLATGSIPIISPLAMTTDGKLLNVNADTIASAIATGLSAQKLILLTTVPGILADPADPASLLHWTDLDELTAMEGQLSGGMRPKLAAIRAALRGGVPRVHVIDGLREGALLEEIFTNDGCGTLVVLTK